MKVVCSVCREIFSLFSEVSAVECGHLFHYSCISKWCEANPSCPYCRYKIKNLPLRIEFEMKNYDDDKLCDSNHEELTRDFLILREEEKELKLEYDRMKEDVIKLEKEAFETERKAKRVKDCVNVWERELKNAKNGYDLRERLKNENRAMETEIILLTRLKKLIYGSENDMQEILAGRSITSETIEELCKYVQAMKYKLKKKQEDYKEQEAKLISLTEDAEKEFLDLNEKRKEKKQVSDKSVQTEKIIIRKVNTLVENISLGT